LTVNSQTFDKCIYEQLAVFFDQKNPNSVIVNESDIEDNFMIMPLLNDTIFLNYKMQIYIVSPNYIEDIYAGIIFIEKDSINVYDINLLDVIIERIMCFSDKYPEIFDNEVALSLINDMLKIHSNYGKKKIMLVNDKKCEYISRTYNKIY
jgi:hypothetical protein